jgi:tetratricopeptide (TPR) repeat protein
MGPRSLERDVDMSMRPWICGRCQGPCRFLGLELLAGQDTGTTYGVSWGCSACDYKALDVCPLGPLIPSESDCLNCGVAYPTGGIRAACPGCGLTRNAALAFLRPEPVPADPGAAARDLFAEGLFRRGLALLNHALVKEDMGQETPWLLKSTFLEWLGLHAHLLRMLEGALAVGGPPALLIHHGLILHKAGRHEEAIAALRNYLEVAPDGPWAGAAFSNLGLALRALDRHDEAEEMYHRAIRVDAGQVLHYRNLAQLLVDQQRWAGAFGILESGLVVATTVDDKVRMLDGLAFVCAEEERAAQTLEYVDRAIALGANSGRTHYLRGRALALLGRLNEAHDEVRRVLGSEPDNAEAMEALTMIEKALADAR